MVHETIPIEHIKEKENLSPLEVEVQSLQAALTSLSVKMQLVQTQQTGPLFESQSEWKPRLQLSSPPSVVAGLDPPPVAPVVAPVSIRKVPGVVGPNSPLQWILITAIKQEKMFQNMI